MTNNFDMLKVSGQIKTNVANIISDGKVRNAADTKEEFAKLQDLLSGANNPDDVGYVKSKMDEYTVKYKLQDLRNRASDYIKRMVDNAKAAFKPKKELNQYEAEILIHELRKAVAENRPNDAEYIREELHRAGFDNLLKEFDETNQKNCEDKKVEKNAYAKECDKTEKLKEEEPHVQPNKPKNSEEDNTVTNDIPKKKTKKSLKGTNKPKINELPIPPGLPKDEKIVPPWSQSIFGSAKNVKGKGTKIIKNAE